MDVQSAMRRWARHGAVVLVGLHVVAITVAALPSPGGGLRRADWAQPTVQGEFAAWAGRLQALGVEITVDGLQDRAFGVAKSYAKAHRAAKRPFKNYYRHFGTWQTWRMFVAPHRFPSRLQIVVHSGSGEHLVYEARHPTARWLGTELDHDRFRSALFRYGWGRKYPSHWRTFGDWVARRAARDFPDAHRIELRFHNYRTPSPAETRAGLVPEVTVSRQRLITLDTER